MRKSITLLTVYTVLFVLGLSGCDNTSSNDGSSLFDPDARGELAITVIDPVLRGSFVYICSSGNEVNPQSNYLARSNSSIDSTVSIFSSASSKWGGTGLYYVYLVMNSTVVAVSSQTDFTNGNATINGFTPGGLTISGIDSSLYGGLVYIYPLGTSSSPVATSSIPNTPGPIRINLSSAGSNPWWDDTEDTYDVYFEKGATKTGPKSTRFVNGSAKIEL
jgi:hypothetical protein